VTVIFAVRTDAFSRRLRRDSVVEVAERISRDSCISKGFSTGLPLWASASVLWLAAAATQIRRKHANFAGRLGSFWRQLTTKLASSSAVVLQQWRHLRHSRPARKRFRWEGQGPSTPPNSECSRRLLLYENTLNVCPGLHAAPGRVHAYWLALQPNRDR
jgi:hypothetical protein